MCEKHLYTYDAATGVEKFTDRKLCSHAAHGKTCTRTQEYRHPHNETPYPAHASSRMPPSPPLSDASLHGHSGSDRSYQYINGARVVVSHKPSHRARRNSTLEVPTTTYTVPRTTPPHSPPRPYLVQPAAPPSPTYYERPSRGYYSPSPEVHYEPNVTRTRRRSHSHSRPDAEELRRLRVEDAKEVLRQHDKVQSKIDKQNQRIASRPPMTRLPAAPPAPQPVRYRRGSVSIPATDMRRVHFDTQDAEDDALRERLKARLDRPRDYNAY